MEALNSKNKNIINQSILPTLVLATISTKIKTFLHVFHTFMKNETPTMILIFFFTYMVLMVQHMYRWP